MPEPRVEESKREAVATLAPRADILSLLYQGMITAATRVRSGDRPMPDVPSFRKNLLDMLAEVEREAFRLRYEKQHVADATFAVIAYIDESIFGSHDPQRHQWTALQGELFGKAIGGEDYFKRVDDLRRQPDSAQLADVLEVYLLCLLLGYQGRYGKIAPGELRRVVDDLEARIDRIRGRSERFSPETVAGPEIALRPRRDRTTFWMAWTAAVLLALVMLLWMVFKAHLGALAQEALKSLPPD